MSYYAVAVKGPWPAPLWACRVPGVGLSVCSARAGRALFTGRSAAAAAAAVLVSRVPSWQQRGLRVALVRCGPP